MGKESLPRMTEILKKGRSDISVSSRWKFHERHPIMWVWWYCQFFRMLVLCGNCCAMQCTGSKVIHSYTPRFVSSPLLMSSWDFTTRCEKVIRHRSLVAAAIHDGWVECHFDFSGSRTGRLECSDNLHRVLVSNFAKDDMLAIEP